MNWKRLLIGLIIGLILIGVPIGIYIYLDDSEPPSHPESDADPLSRADMDARPQVHSGMTLLHYL